MKVPDLVKKFHFLIEQQHFKNMQDIAQKLDKSPNTLKWWIYGSNTHEANTVSKRSVENVTDLFRDHVFPEYSRQEVHLILSSEYTEFRKKALPEENLQWADWIKRKAVYGKARLIPKNADLEIFRIDEEQERVEQIVQINERFRLEFPIPPQSALILGFQSSNSIWARAPVSKNNATIDLPALDLNDQHQYIYEQTPLDDHRFFIVTSSSMSGANFAKDIPIGQVLNFEKLNQLIPLLEHNATSICVQGIRVAVKD